MKNWVEFGEGGEEAVKVGSLVRGGEGRGWGGWGG